VTRLGTQQRPAIARVQTAERAQQILALCNQHRIQCIVGVEPDQREDITDVERALNPSTPIPGLATVTPEATGEAPQATADAGG